MKTEKQCPSYVLREGRTAGCLLDAPGDEILSFTIWNGTHPLLNNSLWISNFCKYPELAAHPPLEQNPLSYPLPGRHLPSGMFRVNKGTEVEPRERGRPHDPVEAVISGTVTKVPLSAQPSNVGTERSRCSPPPRLLFPGCLEGRLPVLDEETSCKGTSHPT